MADPFDLRRFVRAQDPLIDRVRAELRLGDKRSHWMWFVFPQAAGLGFSEMSKRYALSGAKEAAAYLRHPVLGARLKELTAIVNGVQGRTAEQIFGGVDALKFRSCMTLFASVETEDTEFRQALGKYADQVSSH